MWNQMATREINKYFHARFVQILKAPEVISIGPSSETQGR